VSSSLIVESGEYDSTIGDGLDVVLFERTERKAMREKWGVQYGKVQQKRLSISNSTIDQLDGRWEDVVFGVESASVGKGSV